MSCRHDTLLSRLVRGLRSIHASFRVNAVLIRPTGFHHDPVGFLFMIPLRREKEFHMNWHFWVGTSEDTSLASGKGLGTTELDDRGLKLYLEGLQRAQREDFRSSRFHEVFVAPVYEDGGVDFEARLPASNLLEVMLKRMAIKEARSAKRIGIM